MLFTGPDNIPSVEAAAFVVGAWQIGVNADDLDWTPLSGDGSDRSFARVFLDGKSTVVVFGPDPAENTAYDRIGRHIWVAGRFGPEFLASEPDAGFFLIEDLGGTSLQGMFETTDDLIRRDFYEKVIGRLAEFHDKTLSGFDPAWCYQTPKYDRRLILKRETGYFLEAFVSGYMEMEVDHADLASEFEALASAALADPNTVLMHRDFQSRNVMIKDGKPRFIDFQGARPGPAGYDVAALLFDPYVRLDDDFRRDMADFYIGRRRGGGSFGEKDFTKTYPNLAICRLLQALGAYGFLTRVKGKDWFEPYIIPALTDLTGLISDRDFDSFTGLRRLIIELAERLEIIS